MDVSTGVSLKINAPEFFQDAAFQKWLNNRQPKMTWHQGGVPTEWSDTVVMVDPSFTGEGTDADMPEHIWDKIVTQCRNHFSQTAAHNRNHVMVRLTNV